MLQRLTQTLDFNAQALKLRAQRQQLIASNIANVDTPGYAARDIDFAQALRQASGASDVPAAAMRGTHQSHIASGTTADGLSASTLRYAMPAQTNLDSNSVDMDRERASFAENAVKYEATLRFLNGSLRSLQDAMRSPSQG